MVSYIRTYAPRPCIKCEEVIPSPKGPQRYCEHCKTTCEVDRKLRKGENAHHRDGNRLNNDPANIELWSTYQPSGQRVHDKVAAAIKILREHPDILADEGFRLIALESQEATDILADEGFGEVSDSILGFMSYGA